MSDFGSVILIGAGPGDAGLMTVRGAQALKTADVVLYDRLISGEILAMIPDTAIKVDVGKESGHHSIPQGEINGLLLAYAREGKRVARLKGGDPYLFGRGAEEIETLAQAGVPFTVVPGVTSAIAVPSYAGIPVSHRDLSSSVHIITAHRKNGGPPSLDYESLIKFGGTYVFLMGLSSLAPVTEGLLAAGMDAKTPSALIENGTRQNQRKLVSTLSEISGEAVAEGFLPPSILIVGEVCSLSETFDWFSRLPLKGVKILVTRPKAGSALSISLRELGADVTDFPCIRLDPLPVSGNVFESLGSHEWIVFTSPAGAEMFFDGLMARNLDIRSLYGVKFAAVGEKTASAIKERGIRVDFIPEKYSTGELAAGLPEGKSALLFRAEEGAPELARLLRDRGFSVEDVSAYKTLRENSCPEEVKDMLEGGEFDFVTFTSASTVQGFTASLPGFDHSKLTAVCIGGETASEARKHGFRILISEKATIDSMIELIREEMKK